MKTKSERFVNEKRGDWKRLLELLGKISRKGIGGLDADETEDFPRLYRKTCQDLAEARMLRLSPDVLEYLNGLTGQAHHHLYFMAPLSPDDLSRFFRVTLPAVLIRNRIFVLAALFLFWGSFAGSYFASLSYPDFPSRFLSDSMLEYMEDMYREPVGTGRSGGEKAGMAAFYIQHNISISFLCFATGVFLGAGSVYFLIYNGIFLGTVLGYLTAAGLGANIGEFVTAHSFLELNGIALSGAAGLHLGFSLLAAWKNYSLSLLGKAKMDILTLVAASALMLFFAALLESILSPSALGYQWKLGAALLSAGGLSAYFLIYPMRKGRGL